MGALNPVSSPGTPNAVLGQPSQVSDLRTTVEPAQDAAGYVFKVIEQFTGRVIVELPSQLSPAESKQLNKDAGAKLDLQV